MLLIQFLIPLDWKTLVKICSLYKFYRVYNLGFRLGLGLVLLIMICYVSVQAVHPCRMLYLWQAS